MAGVTQNYRLPISIDNIIDNNHKCRHFHHIFLRLSYVWQPGAVVMPGQLTTRVT